MLKIILKEGVIKGRIHNHPCLLFSSPD